MKHTSGRFNSPSYHSRDVGLLNDAASIARTPSRSAGDERRSTIGFTAVAFGHARFRRRGAARRWARARAVDPLLRARPARGRVARSARPAARERVTAIDLRRLA